MLFKRYYFLLFLLGIISVTSYADDELIISGSPAIKAILDCYKPQIEQQTKLKINIIGSSSVQGVDDLINNKVDMAISTSPLQYLAKKLPTVDITSLRTFSPGKSSVAFIVNLVNPVKTLTMYQLLDILNGKITNWQQLGGDDYPIIIITEPKGNGVRSLVEDNLLHQDINIPVKSVANIMQIKTIVADLPNALGIIALAVSDATVINVKMDAIIPIPVIFIARPQPNPLLTKFIDALIALKLLQSY